MSTMKMMWRFLSGTVLLGVTAPSALVVGIISAVALLVADVTKRLTASLLVTASGAFTKIIDTIYILGRR
ncbi:MAG: hypothetical protein ACW99G_21065 [Candidatus Thorarchaeota archaeon]